MKKTLFFLTLSLFSTLIYSQEENQLQLLDKYIVAHNLGSDEAISKFIEDVYEPSLLKKLDIKKQIEFYNMIVTDFGPLNNEIYEVMEVKPTKLVVQLIKKEESLLNKSIDPTEILMVEIDTSEKEPNYLVRGLGLGALVCSIKEE